MHLVENGNIGVSKEEFRYGKYECFDSCNDLGNL
jgi:hypothetical protein